MMSEAKQENNGVQTITNRTINTDKNVLYNGKFSKLLLVFSQIASKSQNLVP